MSLSDICVNYYNDIEDSLKQHIFDVLQGGVLMSFWNETKYEAYDDGGLYSSLLNGCVMITPQSMPYIYAIAFESLSNIRFEHEKIDFFLMSDTTPNAFSIGNPANLTQYYIIITSGLVNLLNDEELRFVIGHEIGHIKRKDIQLERLISFVFPNEESIPLVLRHTIRLWRQLTELGADIEGYLACHDFEVSMSALNKIVMGVGYERLHSSSKELLVYHKGLLEKLRDQPNLFTHPGLSIRIANLDNVANAESVNQINEGMSYLAELMLEVGNGDADRYMSLFIATAGLIVAESDGELSDEERFLIYDHLSVYCIFPRPFLNRVAKADVKRIFTESVKILTRINPNIKVVMMAYMSHLVISDGKVHEEELSSLYRIGEQYFDLSRQEVVGIIARVIKQFYVPQYEMIY